MKKWLCAASLCGVLLFPHEAEAHIMNGSTLFTDIANTKEQSAILYTKAIGLITTTDLNYHPEELLSNTDFALWYGASQGWKGKDAAIIEKAVEHEIIPEENGYVTYEQVNAALFDSKIELEQPEKEVTRAAYAAFVMAHASDDLNDSETLLESEGFEKGPEGLIESVSRDGASYVLTVDGEAYTLSEHPTVDSDSVDPLVWQGQQLMNAVVSEKATTDKEGTSTMKNEAQLHYVSVQPVSKQVEQKNENDTATVNVQKTTEQLDEANESTFPWLSVGIGILVVALLGVVLIKRRGK